MTAARTGRKQPSIRTLWAIAKSPELHLTDEDLHAVVYRETGKESMKMLTQGEVNTVARVLQNMKDSVSRSVRDKRTDTGGDIRTTAQRRKIYALCEALGWNDDPPHSRLCQARGSCRPHRMAEHGAMREGHRRAQGNPRTAAPEGGGAVIEERAILAALERIARMQDSIRSGMDICRDTGLVFLRVYYEQLPPNVARRLTELHAEDMAEIPRATSTEGTAQDRQRLGEKLASDAATAQVVRAMNVYRARLGYGPQEGGDGAEAAGGDM